MMRKLIYGIAIAMISTTAAHSQTLFTYGKKTVSKAEFIKAFNKNPGAESDRKKALKEYLDLYVNFKLKVQAAYDAGMQKEPNYKYESDNFKRQLAVNAINEESNVSNLMAEAHHRSQKDIHIAHIMISYNGTDTAEARQKAWEAYNALAKISFDKIAKQYSTDASAQHNGGDLGYITAFTLDYNFENIVYGLKPGEYSKPYKSDFAYHIFKNVAERKAVGLRTVSQILFAMPQNATQDVKVLTKAKADSVYNLIANNNIEFKEAVKTFSNDVSSMYKEGQLPEFGIGKYNYDFEKVAFALNTPGDISKPFETKYGYHIIKLDAVNDAVKDPNTDAEYADALRKKVTEDNRLKVAKEKLYTKWKTKTGYKESVYNKTDLYKYTDSFKTGKSIKVNAVNDSTVLFRFAKQKITASDFGNYVRAMSANGMAKDYEAMMKEFVNKSTEDYYTEHIDEYNATLKAQLTEFNEANLLFAVMEKEVWAKASQQEKPLINYYEANKAKYKWDESADVILMTVPTLQMADSLANILQQQKGKGWQDFILSSDLNLHADSSRYEIAQLPAAGKTKIQAGEVTPPMRNGDESFSFAYIVKTYPANEQRSFTESRGLVINDYQQVLEEKWIAQLKKKYPVKINQTVFSTVK